MSYIEGYLVAASIPRPSPQMWRIALTSAFAFAEERDNKLILGLSRTDSGDDDCYYDPIALAGNRLDSIERHELRLSTVRYNVHPAIRKEENVSYWLMGQEIGSSDENGFHFGQVICGYEGIALNPYYIYDPSECASDWHPSVRFSGRSLGRVGIFAESETSCRLVIDRARLHPRIPEPGSERIRVRGSVVRSNMKITSFENRVTIGEAFKEWRLALSGLYDRLACGYCRQSHYRNPYNNRKT